MSNYDPKYEWFETEEDLLADNPVLTSYGDNVANQIDQGLFVYGRFGGCLSATLTCTQEMLTLLRRGWWVLAYQSPDEPSIWVGRIFDLIQGDNDSQISLLGPIHYFNGFLRQVPKVDGLPLEVAIYDMAVEMKKVNSSIPGAFLPNAILCGHYPGWDPQGQDTLSFALSTKRNFQSEAALIAGASENLFYGFFPGDRKIWISQAEFEGETYAEIPDCTPLDFQVARGVPKRARFFQDKNTAYVTINRKAADERFNRVVLSGANRENVWVAQDLAALATEPVMTVWARREEISDPALGQRIADDLLALGTRSQEFYDIALVHDTTDGSTSNLVQRGPVFPWSDRPVIKDKFGIHIIAQGGVQGSVLTMAHQPSQRIQVGISNNDLRGFFQLNSFDRSPSQDHFAYPGVLPWETDDHYEGPDDIPDPPVGLFFRPVYQSQDPDTEVITDVVPSTVYRYKNMGVVGTEFAGNYGGRVLHRLITKGDRFSTVEWDPAYPYRLGALDQLELYRVLRWADPMTIPFWRDFESSDWRTMATIFENGEILSTDELLTRSGSFLWTNYKVDEASVKSMVQKLRWGQISSSDIYQLQYPGSPLVDGGAFQGYIVDPDPGAEDDPLDDWIPSPQKYEHFHFVPYSLILHLGGKQRGLIPGASSSDAFPNWTHVLGTLGGAGSIYSVECTFYPYEVTVALPAPLADADPYYPAKTIQSNDTTSVAKNIFYLTKAGAAEAISRGYFWHEVLSWDNDETVFDFECIDGPLLDAHNMGRFGIFTERKSIGGIQYDDYVQVPLDINRLLTLYDVKTHPVTAPFSEELPQYYTGPDGYGSLITRADAMPNESNTDDEVMDFREPSVHELKLVRKKIFFETMVPAPPDLYKGDSRSTTYPPPVRMRRWKVRGFDDADAAEYNAVNNQ